MKATELHLAIMNRDECTLEEADVLVKEMQTQVYEGENPEDVLFSEGFEPDYIFDLLY